MAKVLLSPVSPEGTGSTMSPSKAVSPTSGGLPSPQASSPTAGAGLARSLEHLVANLLDGKHFSKVHRIQAASWDRNHSLFAAIALLEQHDVVVTDAERAHLETLDEENMIEALVKKMPNQSEEEFATFFGRLQLVVSTAGRVRSAINAGDTVEVELALQDAEKTGIESFILKMSVAYAGEQVKVLQREQRDWAANAQTKLSTLVRSQGDVIQARERSAVAKGKLSAFAGAHSRRAKSVLTSLVSHVDRTLLQMVTGAWAALARRAKAEAQIYEEYRERLEGAQQQVLESDKQALQAATRMFGRKAADQEGAWLAACFGALRDAVAARKAEEVAAQQLAEMQAKLQVFSDTQAENARKVMAKMAGANDASLVATGFKAWAQVVEDEKKAKAFEDEVAEAQRALEKMTQGKDGALALMKKMQAANDSDLTQTVFQEWAVVWREGKHARGIAEVLSQQANKLLGFAGGREDQTISAAEKLQVHSERLLQLRVFTQWRSEAKIGRIFNRGHKRLDGKRIQLQKVQAMFREFAKQLEMSLRTSLAVDDGWGSAVYEVKARKMAKSEATVSLPDIHHKHQPGSRADALGGGARY